MSDFGIRVRNAGGSFALAARLRIGRTWCRSLDSRRTSVSLTRGGTTVSGFGSSVTEAAVHAIEGIDSTSRSGTELTVRFRGRCSLVRIAVARSLDEKAVEAVLGAVRRAERSLVLHRHGTRDLLDALAEMLADDALGQMGVAL